MPQTPFSHITSASSAGGGAVTPFATNGVLNVPVGQTWYITDIQISIGPLGIGNSTILTLEDLVGATVQFQTILLDTSPTVHFWTLRSAITLAGGIAPAGTDYTFQEATGVAAVPIFMTVYGYR